MPYSKIHRHITWHQHPNPELFNAHPPKFMSLFKLLFHYYCYTNLCTNIHTCMYACMHTCMETIYHSLHVHVSKDNHLGLDILHGAHSSENYWIFEKAIKIFCCIYLEWVRTLARCVERTSFQESLPSFHHVTEFKCQDWWQVSFPDEPSYRLCSHFSVHQRLSLLLLQ